MLRALDWNPDNPNQVVEEARSWDPEEERLYFDYLGVAPQTRAPVVLVEAKAYDVGAPRQPRGAQLDARAMAELISGAIADLKSGRRDHPILAEWAEWLSDLRTYVASLDALGRSTLRRVVSTAGRWVVVFEEPLDVFTGEGHPVLEKNLHARFFGSRLERPHKAVSRGKGLLDYWIGRLASLDHGPVHHGAMHFARRRIPHGVSANGVRRLVYKNDAVGD